MSERIKKLRELLNARGIKWYIGGNNLTQWDVDGLNFAAAALWPRNDETQTKIIVHVSGLTPEQAVGLSLERTCHDTREFGDFTCSVCGCVVWDTFNENPTISKNGRYAELNYCPHCGAKVVEE